jgi:zinc transporter 1/2/3
MIAEKCFILCAQNCHIDNENNEFPLAEFVICCGFFLIYLFEEIIHSCIDHSHRHSPQTSLPQVTTCHHSRQNSFIDNKEQKSYAKQALIPKNNPKAHDHCNGYGATVSCRNPSHATSADESNAECEIHVETIINCETQVGVTTFFRSLMIVAALSFHSFFEGLTIGLSDTKTGVWQLLFAIAIHKFVISFAVGLEIYSETFNLKRVFVYMLVFSLFSPLGIMTAAIAKLQVNENVILKI